MPADADARSARRAGEWTEELGWAVVAKNEHLPGPLAVKLLIKGCPLSTPTGGAGYSTFKGLE